MSQWFDKKLMLLTPLCNCCFDWVPCHFFATKTLCDLSKVITHYSNHMWHLQLKSNHLRLKKPIVNMQIPCNDY